MMSTHVATDGGGALQSTCPADIPCGKRLGIVPITLALASFLTTVPAEPVFASQNAPKREQDDTVLLPAISSSGSLVLFGDSITAYGDYPDGWVQLLRRSVREKFGRGDIKIINAGQGGDTVDDLHRRFFWRLWRKPDVVVLCIGINDARRAASLGYTALDLEEYRKGLSSLVSKLSSTGAQVVVVSPIVSGERMRGHNEMDEIIDAYASAAAHVAGEYGAVFVDARSQFFEHLASANLGSKGSGILTVDGLHLNKDGNALLAALIENTLVALPQRKPKQ